jgi:hypothetical protein
VRTEPVNSPYARAIMWIPRGDCKSSVVEANARSSSFMRLRAIKRPSRSGGARGGKREPASVYVNWWAWIYGHLLPGLPFLLSSSLLLFEGYRRSAAPWIFNGITRKCRLRDPADRNHLAREYERIHELQATELLPKDPAIILSLRRTICSMITRAPTPSLLIKSQVACCASLNASRLPLVNLTCPFALPFTSSLDFLWTILYNEIMNVPRMNRLTFK